jgi:hypothetical protein
MKKYYCDWEIPRYNVKMPKLYKVKYAETVDGVLAAYQRSYKDCLVDAWLEENCEYPYYHSPGYLTEKFIEFVDSRDAMMFALRWA